MFTPNGEKRGRRKDNFVILFYKIDLELLGLSHRERKGMGQGTFYYTLLQNRSSTFVFIENGEERAGRKDHIVILFYKIDLKLSGLRDREGKEVGVRMILLYSFTK